MRPATLILFSLFSALPTLAGAEPAPAWNYMGGANDDEGWGLLSKEYAKCTLGNQQSPVAINEAKVSAMGPLKFDYTESNVVEQHRELTLLLQFNDTDANSLRHEGETYTLKQIRFHTPSEHSIKGAMPPMEIQFIHQQGEKVMIVAVAAMPGDENASLKTLIEHLPFKGFPEQHIRFDAKGLLPIKQGFYAYTGSLSWPPCYEGVEWRVMKEPITISKEQLKTLSHFLGRNARLPQPIYFRTITQTME